MKKVKKQSEATKPDSTAQSIKSLSKEVSRMADILDKQNHLKRRFLLGLIFGLGTALGASVIASILVLSLSRLLSLAGIDSLIVGDQAVKTFEQQIKLQTPQE